jgi:hypothetical protein
MPLKPTALKKIMATMSGHAIEYNQVQTKKSGCEGNAKAGMLVAGSPLFELNAKAGMLAAAGVLF